MQRALLDIDAIRRKHHDKLLEYLKKNMDLDEAIIMCLGMGIAQLKGNGATLKQVQANVTTLFNAMGTTPDSTETNEKWDG